MKLIDWPKYSSVLSKRSVDSKQKNRRCSAKESTMLRGSSQYTLRYHLTAMHREVVIRNKTECNHCLFHLGFVKLSLCCLPVCGFIWSNTIEMGGFGKDTCFSDEIQYPYEGFCESLNHSWQRKGSTCHILQLPQCMDRVIFYTIGSVSLSVSEAGLP